ncbi:MAG: hypothetical protein K2J82_11005 [Muribaculaceae bacterium]|nr:hypothetical protein [Muribaculaceae bacterium]MDE6755123.1 hypothetical protein [Muribaculaceae bacterium]
MKIKIGAGVALASLMLGFGNLNMSAQNSMPAPGSGGAYNPAPIGAPMPPVGPAPIAPGGPGFGGPGWGWNNSPVVNPVYANQGTVNVVALGYDNFGRLRTIPMTVAYTFSYGEYDATVLSAYNPFTMSWMPGLNVPAYNTSYYLNGTTFNFYVPLSTGTYYFNL